MIVQLSPMATQQDRDRIEAAFREYKFTLSLVQTRSCAYLIAVGGSADLDIRLIGHLPGVKDVHFVRDSYQLSSSKWKVQPTVIDLGDGVRIGGGELALAAGPCSIESEAQVEAIADHLKASNVRIMRGGVFKPRTSPYSFRGGGIEFLTYFSEIAHSRGLKVITEVLEPSQIEPMHDLIDIYQVGARNSQNFSLLHELGKAGKPVMIKRGMSGTIDELLQSAEYVFSAGNEQIILCERGIRTYENAYRNTFDINAIPILKEKTHLPVLADPSHGIGIRRFVPSIAYAAVAAGADGVIVEIHPTPELAKSDADQTLDFDEASRLFEASRKLAQLRESF